MILPNGRIVTHIVPKGFKYKEKVCEFRSLRKKIIYSIWLVEHTKGDALIHPWGVMVNPPIIL